MLQFKTGIKALVCTMGFGLAALSQPLLAQDWSMETVANELKKLEQQAPKKEQQQINALLEQFKQIEKQTTPEQRAQINKMLKALQNIDTSKLNPPKVSGSVEVKTK